MGNFKMNSITATFFIGCLVLVNAVTPLTPEELQQIRDFTAKAHMKRLETYPDQIMTPSTHYLGRRIPPQQEKQPTIFMQAPSSPSGSVVKPQQTFTVEPQQAGAVQNYLLNYALAPNSLNHQQQAAIHHQQQQQAIQQQQQIQQQQIQQQQQLHHQFQRPQPAFPFIPVQNAPQGPLRGPPPTFGRRPSFLQLPESAPSIFSFFFPKRAARRPSFRPPLRFEFTQAASQNQALLQHQQNIHNVMAQQHLLTVQQQQPQQQQQQQGQQSVIRPSTAPLSSGQATTIKNSQVTPTILPSSVSPLTTVVTASTPTLVTNPQLNYGGHGQLVPLNAPPLLNQFHRDISFLGKPFGKPIHPPKYQTVAPQFIPQNRPGDMDNYIQKYVSPQPDFSFFGPHGPPVIAGPTSHRFNSPVSFTHIEQMPFMQQSPPLPMHMVVQSQEFPNYQFTTTFTASGADNNIPSSSPPSASQGAASQETTIKPFDAQANSQSSTKQTHRVKKIRTRPTTVSTSTISPSTTRSLGEVIFESSKETREFHDSTRISQHPTSVINTGSNSEILKVRKNKSTQSQKESHEKSVAESSVVLAPLVFTEELREPSTSTTTSSPRPSTTTAKAIPTSVRSTTTQDPSYNKPKIVKSKGVEYHKSKNIHHNYEKRVTASGAGQSAVTVEPYRSTSTGSSSRVTSPGGRVVTTSVTSRVVSIGPQHSQKRYRLRKVKVPNPDAKKTTTTTTTSATSSVSTSSSSSPTTTPISTSVGTSRSTSTPASTSSTDYSTTLA